MRKQFSLALAFLALLIPCAARAQTSNPSRVILANEGATGTTLNKLTKLTGAPSTAVLAGTSDTGGVIGITIAGAGTSGNATIQIFGIVPCVFDAATTAGHYVQISSSSDGDCHDSGASYPASGQVLGRVLSTNGGGGTYSMDLYPAEISATAGSGGSVASVFGRTGAVLPQSGDYTCAEVTNCLSSPVSGANGGLNADASAFTGVLREDSGTGSAAELSGVVRTSASNVTTPGKADVMQTSFYCPDAGSNDTYACNLSPAVTAYVAGTHYRFKANTANTGAASINFNGVGDAAIKKAAGGVTTALADNDIRAGQIVDVVYDGTNMQMQSTLGNTPSGSAAWDTITNPSGNQALTMGTNSTAWSWTAGSSAQYFTLKLGTDTYMQFLANGDFAWGKNTGEGTAATMTVRPTGTRYAFNVDMSLATSGQYGYYTTTNGAPAIAIKGSAPTTFTAADMYLRLGDNESATNSGRLIGFGYTDALNHFQGAYFGFIETANGGYENGDLVFATRSSTNNAVAPTVNFKVLRDGNISVTNLLETYQSVATAGNGAPVILGVDDKTAQTGNVGPVTLFTTPASGSYSTGLFVADIYLYCSTGEATTTVGVTVAWNDGTAQSVNTISNSSSCATTGLFYVGSQIIDSAASQAITYSTTAANFTTGNYRVRVRLRAN